MSLTLSLVFFNELQSDKDKKQSVSRAYLRLDACVLASADSRHYDDDPRPLYSYSAREQIPGC